LLNFILRRLLLMIPTTLGVAAVVFAIYHLAPGDPATVMMGMGSGGQMGTSSDSESKIEAFRIKHGLDRHPVIQFLDYVGPVNLSRDGHPFFSSPYGERKIEEVELSSGARVREGKPLAIGHLPATGEAERERIDEASARLLDDGAGEAAWAAARAELGALDTDEVLPALLSALFALRLETDTRTPAIERLAAVLEEVTGAACEVHPERAATLGSGATIREWFRWYYEDGGGDRVRNSGQRPWGGLLCLDLGNEMQAKTSVAEELGRRLAVTVPLSLISVLLSYLIALPMGIFSVRRQGTRADGALTVTLFVLYSIPTFWAGLMLILIFGKTGLDWLPVLGLHDKDADSLSRGAWLWDLAKHTVLPVVTLTYGSLAYLSRQMRAGMLEVIRQDYIRTARAKGLSERVVVYKHALRNSMIPVLTLLASILPILIGGSIIVEKVFDIPGMGKYAFEGLLRRDFYIVMATTIFVGIMTQVGILLSDITYSLVDPRIRHD
jgi:peptide/nickel transport system permease protein